MFHFASVDESIEALSNGRILIVVDSEDRENEGDFLVAADAVTPEMIHFMVTHGRGHLCMPISQAIADRLSLQPLVPREDLTAPCFTVPLDSQQCKTGISPLDRSITIQAMLDPYAAPQDFIRPGHIFPLIAAKHGLLRRQGHTEAAVDLACLASRAPAGVLCEICSRDGVNMAQRDELIELAKEFHLPMVTIDELVSHVESADRTAIDALQS